MKILRPSTWFALAIAALIVVLPFQSQFRHDAGGFAVEVNLTSHQASELQLYFDSGSGFNEAASTIVPLLARDGPLTYRLALPQGDYRNLRLDPMDRDGTVVIHSVRVVDRSGAVMREFSLGSFRPNAEISSVRAVPEGIEVIVVPGKSDPQLSFTTDPPLSLHVPRPAIARGWLRSGGAVFVVFICLGTALEFAPKVRSQFGRLLGWMQVRPQRAIAIAGLFGVVASCYPIILAGRSFVSPNYGAQLLYDQFPTLPGYTASRIDDVRGSDIGAIMWQQVPYSSIQHRSLFWDFELPLWNRENAGGTPLLGQGQSMFGDPLHCLVIAANGAAWAWDLKFLIARWLLALGSGLCVWALVRHRGAAMLVAVAAPFCGFFLYRINHPAVFSFCYAPWILYFWLRVVQASSWRTMSLAGAGLLLANWTEFTSGTVKEAYSLLLTFNLIGAVILLFAGTPWRWRLRQFGALGAAGVLFIGLASPWWYTFLDALRSGFTASESPAAWQIQPSLLIGLFDEALFRPINRDQMLFNPSANFLLLAGVLYCFATFREQVRNRLALGLLVGSVLPFSLVFGFVPPDWIDRIPFLGNIRHLDDCFCCPLILLVAVVAGLGFAAADRRLRTADGPADLGVAAVLLGALLWAYFGFGHASHRALLGDFTPRLTVWPTGTQMDYGSFVPGYLTSLLLALGLGAVLVRRALTRAAQPPALAIALAVCALALVWRGGAFTGEASWPDFTALPPPRVNFRTRSPVEKELEKSERQAPSRAIGLQGNFFPGWTAMYGLEGVSGPDALASPYYRELTFAAPLQRVWDWRLYISRENLAASRPFLDLLNAKHYLDLHSDQGALGAVLKLDQLSDLDLYESRTVWPRAFFVDRLKSYGTAAELAALIKADRDQPFAAVQSGEITPSSPLTGLMSSDSPAHYTAASEYHLTENSTSFTIHAAAAGLAVLTETYWAGYPHVKVDGQPVEAIRANHAFIGIPISAGDHRIAVRYRPRFFDLNLLIAVVSGLLLAGGFWAAWRLPPLPA